MKKNKGKISIPHEKNMSQGNTQRRIGKSNYWLLLEGRLKNEAGP